MKSAQLADKQLVPIITTLAQEKPLPTNSPPELFRAFLQNGISCGNIQPSSSSTEKVHFGIPGSMITTILQQLHNNTGHLGVQRITEMSKIDSTGLDINRILRSGCKNASNARSGTLRNPNLELHLEQ